MAQVTDLLTSTAEISNLMSVVVVLAGLLVMLVFLLKLIYQDLADGDGSGVTKVNVKTPQTVMTRVDVPFTLSLSSSFLPRVALTVSAKCSYSAQIYWAVPISTFHHLLRAPWPWFFKAATSSHSNCQIFPGCQSEVRVSNPHQDREFSLECPPDLQLGQAPREVYPLVVVLVKSDSHVIEDLTEVTALVFIIHLKDSSCPIPSQILSTYIRQGAGLTQLRPLYVSEDGAPGEFSDTESAEDSETEDWPSAAGLRARCVVCQTGRVNRVALPCRHASTCHACFDRLKSRCPMCRGFISSYFLLFPDPVFPRAPDSDGSDESPAPEAPRTWRSMWREFNVRLNTAMGLREN